MLLLVVQPYLTYGDLLVVRALLPVLCEPQPQAADGLGSSADLSWMHSLFCRAQVEVSASSCSPAGGPADSFMWLVHLPCTQPQVDVCWAEADEASPLGQVHFCPLATSFPLTFP